MESPDFTMLSSLRGDFKSDDFIQPHYKETYRLAIDRLLSGGRDSYQEFLKGERTGSFLSEDELLFITENAEHLPPQSKTEETDDPTDDSTDNHSSSGTYWPIHSDVQTPDLDLGWPEFMHEQLQTNIDLLFHPPRQNKPTIKEVIRKHLQDARQVIAIVMDSFTDVDIFRETVDASIRGVPVYVLLDDFHLKSFLTMVENQDVKIQQLRNMRVRTVKGQDYLCRSGAKFHGAMEQKFLLVDCHTAIYGSYSFTWSFEKINLSMVQVISGHLVKLYDEEFRTLYARSSAPTELCPPDGLFQRQILPKSHAVQSIDRREQLRHTLDTVYRKTCERKQGMRDFEEEPNKFRPLIENGIGAQNHLSHLQPADAMNFYKRHSYAGEREDGLMPGNMRSRVSNWNISRETGNGNNNYPMDSYLSVVPQIHRSLHQSFHGNDKQVLSMQQNMPTLENTSKAFMRTWRIESYLKNPDVPFGDSYDYLDQFESVDKAGLYMQGRMRSSLALMSNIPEQMQPNRHRNNTSTNVGSSAAQNVPLHYSSMQWNPTAAGENKMCNDELIFKRKSLQIADSYGPRRNAYHSSFTSLGRAKGEQIITNPDILTDIYNKRHSVADPRSNTEYTHDSSGHMHNAFARMQAHRSTAGIHAHHDGHGFNLKEDYRSVSHHDIKGIKDTNGLRMSNWQEPPCRTASAGAVVVNSQDSVETLSLKSSSSTATITEDEEKMADGKQNQSSTNSVNSSSEHQVKWLKDDHRNSKSLAPDSKTTAQKKSSIFDKSTRSSLNFSNSRGKNRDAENRSYSRFESFHSIEKKRSLRTHGFESAQSQEKSKSLPKGEAAAEQNFARNALGHHENKLEKFFQRVGNFIHKNK
ncbi:protein FAM83B [Echeneis naucrates]|uniref:Scaffolding anchor of CK1 domain-containing protein n=1 Tax=Echeneis naucrates TaxID=173247 RepID=A0A665X887_ECHNA|nr:protein FAM83B [Echeneis naucrates]XP_029376177.1 protein FAM83B [Echeneis naucrates]XP_029376178.1 protein FAM83B [Echeneis naucrates]XP_029376179.1 protein FAM83B [Echeneis naucrates]